MDHTINACGKYRNIVFTLNNYSEGEYHTLLNNEHLMYVFIGKEVGSNRTKHLQGDAELRTEMRFNAIKNKINGKMYFQRRFGTEKEAIDYCKKDNDFVENGDQRIRVRELIYKKFATK